MRRTLLAATLAIPLLLAGSVPSFAHYPQQCSFGQGCGWCVGLCSKMHQHGPLFNYGPYYGYPPFEPYGPWNAYLQYNPWYYGGGGGGHGWGHGGLLHGHGKCLGCGLHAHFLHGGWFHGHACLHCGHGGGWLAGLKCKSCGHGHLLGKGGCSTCQATTTTAAYDPAKTDAVTRYAGAGSPEEFAAFYGQLPSLAPTGN